MFNQKRVIMKRLIMFLGFLLFPVFLMAQEPTVPPIGWGDVFSNPALWLGSFAGVSLLTAFLTAFLNGVLKVKKTFMRQFIAWVVAIIIVEVGVIFKSELIYTHNFTWYLALFHGLAAGLASNGVFDIPTLKKILIVIEGLFNKEKAVE